MTESKGIRSSLPNILTRGPDAVEQSKISILDIQNKFIVHSGSVNGGVKDVFSSWGNLYLITTGGEVQLPPTSLMSDIRTKRKRNV
jgi:hypothetical protein